MKPYVKIEYDKSKNLWHLDAMDPETHFLGISGYCDSKKEAIREANEFFKANGSPLRYKEEWIQLTLF